MNVKLKCGVLTVSDTCAAGQAADKSGPVVAELIRTGAFLPDADVVVTDVAPDDVPKIQAILVEWAMVRKLDLVVTTGGTGLSPRDVTPEAVRAIIDRDIFGMSFAMMAGSLEITPMAMVSRPVCGVKDRTIIITVPGSPKAAKECLMMVAPALPHALNLIRGDNPAAVKSLHSSMQAHTCPGHSQNYPEKPEPSDLSKVARRHRSSPYPMVSFDEALGIILSKVPSRSTLSTEKIDVLSCVGRVLFEDVFAACDIPPFDASIKDGYAVVSADGSGERAVLQSVSSAGVDPAANMEVKPGTCARISTGAPLPPGADAVVQVEDTELVEEANDGEEEIRIRVLVAPSPRLDIRPRGCDVCCGSIILKAGTILGPAETGLLASVGVTSVSVQRLPRIGILSTGNEVVDPWSADALPSGRIWDANGPMLASLFSAKGFPNVKRFGVAPDDESALAERLTAVVNDCDVLVTTGGVSMGEKDLFKYVLTRHLEGEVCFGRVNMKPGKPATFVVLPDGKPVFSLPGNPVSAFVTANLFVLPYLRKYTGQSALPLTLKVAMGHDIELDARPEFHRVKLATDELVTNLPTAWSTGNQLSSRLMNVHCADALVKLPPTEKDFASLSKGAIVNAIVL